MSVHQPHARAGAGVALKSVKKHMQEGGAHGVFATLNVVPMIDMFIILVVFLIQQFSASGELMSINPDVAMPKARAKAELDRAPMIALTRGKGNQPGVVLFENNQVISIADVNEVKFPSWDIKPLAKVLERAWKLQQKSTDKKARKNRKIIIQSDRTVPFEVIKMVMATCGRNEYREPNFAIMVGKDMVE
jgi:biopolymer transport protein ExbD